ncbi:hypothetical protein GCM10020254_06470 [Streptomyces goshikiensis]
MGVYCHERQATVSHETVLLRKYVLVQVCGGRTAILGPDPGGPDDLVASAFPTCTARVPQSMQPRRPDQLFPTRPIGLQGCGAAFRSQVARYPKLGSGRFAP